MEGPGEWAGVEEVILSTVLAVPTGLLQEVQPSTTTLDLKIFFHCQGNAIRVRVSRNWIHSDLLALHSLNERLAASSK